MGGDDDKIIRVGDTLIIKVTPEEEAYRAKYLPDPTDPSKLSDDKLVCTACSNPLAVDVHKGKSLFTHRALDVLVCEPCFLFYGDGCFSTDEDGDDKYCRWCGQGGTLNLCCACNCAFCSKCVKQNLKPSAVKEVERDDWKCYFCNPRPLFGCRAICWGAKELNKIGIEKEQERLKKQKEKLQKLEEKKKEKQEGERKSRKTSSGSEDDEITKKRKSRTRGSDSESSSPEVMPKKRPRTSVDNGLTNGSSRKTRRRRKDSSSEESSDEKRKVTRSSRSSNKKTKAVDSNSDEESNSRSRKAKQRKKKTKSSSDESSDEDQKKSKRKSSKKKADSSDDESDDERAAKKKSARKRKDDSDSSSDEDKRVKKKRLKKKSKKESSSEESSDEDSKKKSKKKHKKKDESSSEESEYDSKKGKKLSKSAEETRIKSENDIVKKRIKLAIVWLNSAVKDIAELGSLIALRATKFGERKINLANLKTYDDVVNVVNKLKQLMSGIHANYEHIEKNMDVHLKPWRELTGLDKTVINKSVGEETSIVTNNDESKMESSTVNANESVELETGVTNNVVSKTSSEKDTVSTDNMNLQWSSLSPDEDSDDEEQNATKALISKANETLEKDDAEQSEASKLTLNASKVTEESPEKTNNNVGSESEKEESKKDSPKVTKKGSDDSDQEEESPKKEEKKKKLESENDETDLDTSVAKERSSSRLSKNDSDSSLTKTPVKEKSKPKKDSTEQSKKDKGGRSESTKRNKQEEISKESHTDKGKDRRDIRRSCKQESGNSSKKTLAKKKEDKNVNRKILKVEETALEITINSQLDSSSESTQLESLSSKLRSKWFGVGDKEMNLITSLGIDSSGDSDGGSDPKEDAGNRKVLNKKVKKEKDEDKEVKNKLKSSKAVTKKEKPKKSEEGDSDSSDEDSKKKVKETKEKVIKKPRGEKENQESGSSDGSNKVKKVKEDRIDRKNKLKTNKETGKKEKPKKSEDEDSDSDDNSKRKVKNPHSKKVSKESDTSDDDTHCKKKTETVEKEVKKPRGEKENSKRKKEKDNVVLKQKKKEKDDESDTNDDRKKKQAKESSKDKSKTNKKVVNNNESDSKNEESDEESPQKNVKNKDGKVKKNVVSDNEESQVDESPVKAEEEKYTNSKENEANEILESAQETTSKFVNLGSSSSEEEEVVEIKSEPEVDSKRKSKVKILKMRSQRNEERNKMTLNLNSSDDEEEKRAASVNLSSDSENDASVVETKKEKIRSPSPYVVSSAASSDSEILPQKKRRKKATSDSDVVMSEEEKKETKTKRKRIRLAESSDGSSGSDSGKVNGKKKKGEKKDFESPGKGGRKNIKKIKTKDDLEEATKNAAEEEKERRRRIEERQKLFNQVFAIPETKVIDKLVLDFDPEEKKELLSVDTTLVSKMKPHQAKGVKFMWDSCFESLSQVKKKKGSGCILAHCMGLGKTFQVISLLHTVLSNEDATGIRTAMVVCPLSTVLNWYNEFGKWLDGVENGEEIEVFHLTRCKQNPERARELRRWQHNGGVMIMGYEMFRNLTADTKKFKAKIKKDFQECLVDPGADLIVCDEGHMLKNEATALSKAMSKIRTLRRIVLTGTPMQNNLVEYHCMVQFVKPNLLGTRKEFLNRFANPIANGQFVDSTEHDVKVMKRRAHVLHKMLEGLVQRFDYNVLTPFLPPKHEYVVNVCLSELQVKLYEHYLKNYSQQCEDKKGGSRLFQDWQALGRIWTHPRVLKMSSEKAAWLREKKALEESDSEGSLREFIDDGSDADTSTPAESSDDNSSTASIKSEERKKKKVTRARVTRHSRATRSTTNTALLESSEDEKDKLEEGMGVEKENAGEWWSEFVEPQHLDDINHSGKLVLLFAILRESELIEDKVLVFSQSLFSLDLIEYFLDKIDAATQEGRFDESLGCHQGTWSKGLDYFRLDGSTSSENRNIWTKSFNREDNPRARLFLISTRAGGLGINLTAANRVIIFDASWNPSHDVQSIFRVYRFGQKKPCYIYRFIAHGTMEEKVYDRQVAKQSMSNRVVDEQQVHRHFSHNDLNELYSFTPPSKKEDRQIPSLPKDVMFAEILRQFSDWIEKYHEHDSLLENVVEEELNEEERKLAWEDFENDKKRGFMPAPSGNINYGAQMQNANTQLQIEYMRQQLKSKFPTKTDAEINQILVYQVTQLMRQQQFAAQQLAGQQVAGQQMAGQQMAGQQMGQQAPMPQSHMQYLQQQNMQAQQIAEYKRLMMQQQQANLARLQLQQIQQQQQRARPANTSLQSLLMSGLNKQQQPFNKNAPSKSSVTITEIPEETEPKKK